MAAIAALLFCADCWAQAKKGISLADLAAYTGADREQLDRIGNSSPIRPVVCHFLDISMGPISFPITD
jgi:hypothetical protein